MSEATLDLQLTHQAFALELLKQEFAEIVSSELPVIDKSVECARLLEFAAKSFEPFVKTAKEHAAEMLVPAPKDEVQIGKTRVVHRIVQNKSLDREAWAKAIGASIKLAEIEILAIGSKRRLDEAQAPYKLPSTWIEFKEAKK
jgi:hypothetical protein